MDSVCSARRDLVHTSTLSVRDGGDAALVECSLEIEVVGGPDVGTKISLPGGRAVIGAGGDDVDLELSDPTVSRRHAELRAVSDGVLVIDLGSKNGTRIADVLIKEALLTTDGTFSVGATLCRVSRRVRTIVTEGPEIERFGDFITCSASLKRSVELLRRVARTETPISIEGEAGTGKQLLARAVHQHSPRADHAWVTAEGSALTGPALENAFTAARGGTLFLRQLGDLSLDLQPRLLRALESSPEQQIDMRFLGATRTELQDLVEEKRLRDDLRFRVAVVRVRVPPLRERAEDIPLLASHYAETLGAGAATLAPETYAALAHYDWPGNVRELRMVIERALATAESDRIAPSDLFPNEERSTSTFHEAKDQLIASFEKRYVKSLLERHEDNVSRAAKEAGLSRNALYALMKRAGLTDDEEA